MDSYKKTSTGGPKNAGHENAAQKCSGGKCEKHRIWKGGDVFGCESNRGPARWKVTPAYTTGFMTKSPLG